MVAWAVDSVKVNVSGRAGLLGSVAGSHRSLRTSFIERPRSYDLILYGPEETGWLV